jgi:hypothetical protein
MNGSFKLVVMMLRWKRGLLSLDSIARLTVQPHNLALFPVLSNGAPDKASSMIFIALTRLRSCSLGATTCMQRGVFRYTDLSTLVHNSRLALSHEPNGGVEGTSP